MILDSARVSVISIKSAGKIIKLEYISALGKLEKLLVDQLWDAFLNVLVSIAGFERYITGCP